MKILPTLTGALAFSSVANSQVQQGVGDKSTKPHLRGGQKSVGVVKFYNKPHDEKLVFTSRDESNIEQNNGNINFSSAFEFAGTVNSNDSYTLYPTLNIGLGPDYEASDVCSQTFEDAFFGGKSLSLNNLETFTGKKIASVDDVRSAIKSFCGDAEQTPGSENTDSHVGTINISTIIEMFNNGETTPTQNLLLLLHPEILSTYISDLPSTDS